MLGLLDEAISGLRVAAGETSFAIDLVATTSPRDAARSGADAQSTDGGRVHRTRHRRREGHRHRRRSRVDSSQRRLPRSTIRETRCPAAWARPTRRWALRTIAEEARIEKAYAGLRLPRCKRATAAAGRADVRAVERVIATVVRRDAQLGRKRPEEINALIEQVRVQLDAARRLRLARDQWHERASSYRAYMKSVAPIIERDDASAAEPRRHQAACRIRRRCARRPRRSTGERTPRP